MIIVDTNVIAYSLIASNQTALAERVLAADPDWAAPWLWRSEMRNLLTVYLRRNALSIDDVAATMHRAVLTVSGREYDVDSNRVLELAHASGCTAYDCEFVALAEKLSVPLVTSDKKVIAAFPDIAVSMEAFAG